eukprot:jgi/Tetstr1/442641/TSEL_030736.t1
MDSSFEGRVFETSQRNCDALPSSDREAGGMAACAVGVFARLPVPGQVKSRCAGVGVTLFNSDPSEKAACEAWLAGLHLDIPVHTQVPDPDLGERMAGAFRHMFEEGAAKAIIIGTDIPDVSADIVTAAFAALDSHQMVLGPACDGGYYLIGLTQPPGDMLKGITWSTDTVYADTASSARKAGLSVAPATTLPKLQDVDYLQDLANWAQGGCPTDFTTPPDHPLLPVAQAAVARAAAGLPQ